MTQPRCKPNGGATDVHWEVVCTSAAYLRTHANNIAFGKLPSVRRKLQHISNHAENIETLNRELTLKPSAAADDGILTLVDQIGRLLADEDVTQALGPIWCKAFRGKMAGIRGAVFARQQTAQRDGKIIRLDGTG